MHVQISGPALKLIERSFCWIFMHADWIKLRVKPAVEFEEFLKAS